MCLFGLWRVCESRPTENATDLVDDDMMSTTMAAMTTMSDIVRSPREQPIMEADPIKSSKEEKLDKGHNHIHGKLITKRIN